MMNDEAKAVNPFVFPGTDEDPLNRGITTAEFFAAQFLAALLSRPDVVPKEIALEPYHRNGNALCDAAMEWADNLLSRRSSKGVADLFHHD